MNSRVPWIGFYRVGGNGRGCSVPHRVVHPADGHEDGRRAPRVFFHAPNQDAELGSLRLQARDHPVKPRWPALNGPVNLPARQKAEQRDA